MTGIVLEFSGSREHNAMVRWAGGNESWALKVHLLEEGGGELEDDDKVERTCKPPMPYLKVGRRVRYLRWGCPDWLGTVAKDRLGNRIRVHRDVDNRFVEVEFAYLVDPDGSPLVWDEVPKPEARKPVEATPGSTGGGRPEGDTDKGKVGRKSQVEVLIGFFRDAYLFRDPTEVTYAVYSREGRDEVYPVKSPAFRRLLIALYQAEQGRPPAAEALKGAVDSVDARAWRDGDTEEAPVRIGGDAGRTVVDLGSRDWRAVEITAAGWSIVERSSARFRRPGGLLPLPSPQPGGSLEDLRPFVRLDDDEFLLFLAWLTASLRRHGPYPVLVLGGEQGTAKSTVCKIARLLVDPNAVPLRDEPKETRDLMITACNSWALVYDNLSGLPGWMSDSFCRLSTGGGHATRALYTDDQEKLFDAQRPSSWPGSPSSSPATTWSIDSYLCI
jgi:hypothetical protein